MVSLSYLWGVVSSDRIWLPGNLTWEDVDAMPHYPRAYHLYYAFLIAAVLAVLRFSLERLLFQPIARKLLASQHKNKLQNNSTLEKAFKENDIDEKNMERLAKEITWTVRQIEVWIRKKNIIISKEKKLKETMWRLMFYTFITIYGFVAVWGKPFIFDISACFSDSPKDEVVTDFIRWYYLIELGFYFSLCASILHDARRKDFAIMITHHVFTLVLISASWVVNDTNVGCLVMVCHDIADIPLEASKLGFYLKKKKMADVIFAAFFVTWCISRLMYFPLIIHGNIFFGAPHFSPFCHYLLNGILLSLFCLHLFWTWMILKMVLQMWSNKLIADVRSDNESNISDDEDTKTK